MMPRLLCQPARGSGLISQTAAAEKGCSLKAALGIGRHAARRTDAFAVLRDGPSWRFRRLQPRTPFSRLPPVRKADPIGQLEVETGQQIGRCPQVAPPNR